MHPQETDRPDLEGQMGFRMQVLGFNRAEVLLYIERISAANAEKARALGSTIEQLRKELDDAKADHSQLSEKTRRVCDELKHQQVLAEQAAAETQRLKQEVEKTRTDAASVLKCLESCRLENRALKEDNSRLNQTIDELTSSLDEKEAELRRAGDEIKAKAAAADASVRDLQARAQAALSDAQQRAESIVKEAQYKADLHIENARQKATAHLAQARKEAELLNADAKTETVRARAKLAQAADGIAASITVLKAQLADVDARIEEASGGLKKATAGISAALENTERGLESLGARVRNFAAAPGAQPPAGTPAGEVPSVPQALAAPPPGYAPPPPAACPVPPQGGYYSPGMVLGGYPPPLYPDPYAQEALRRQREEEARYYDALRRARAEEEARTQRYYDELAREELRHERQKQELERMRREPGAAYSYSGYYRPQDLPPAPEYYGYGAPRSVGAAVPGFGAAQAGDYAAPVYSGAAEGPRSVGDAAPREREDRPPQPAEQRPQEPQQRYGRPHMPAAQPFAPFEQGVPHTPPYLTQQEAGSAAVPPAPPQAAEVPQKDYVPQPTPVAPIAPLSQPYDPAARAETGRASGEERPSAPDMLEDGPDIIPYSSPIPDVAKKTAGAENVGAGVREGKAQPKRQPSRPVPHRPPTLSETLLEGINALLNNNHK